jgi:isoleucyl-tRNA synthetase
VLYIEAPNNKERRSIQTVLYETLVALTKLVAPILPHTADEVWGHIPNRKEQAESVQLVDMPEAQYIERAEELVAKWDAFMAVRDDVLKALEVARNEKVIGKSLTAHLVVYPTNETKQLLDSIEESLKQLFIVSGFEVAGDYAEAPEEAQKFATMAVVVKPAHGDTCERCWVVTPEIGTDADHPTLCPRCASIVKEHYTA